MHPEGAPPTGGPDPAGLPVCYRHPGRHTGVRCTRCDRPICPECMRPASVGFQCPDDARAGQVKQRTAGGGRLRANTGLVTWTLIGVNVLIYLVSALTPGGGLNNPGGSQLFRDWVLYPPAIGGVFPYGSPEVYRLLTSAFLHLSLLHIASNMFALGVLGPFLERYLGRSRFLALYLISALGGGVAVYALGTTNSQTAGASGAIFGLFAAAAVFHREIGLDLQWLIGTIVINVLFTVSVPGISALGHAGGFVVGGVTAYALRLLVRSGRGRVAARRVLAWQQSGAFAVVLVVLVVATAARTASL